MNFLPHRPFTFGRNWQSFLRGYSAERQRIAQEALLSFLKLENLKGKSFLDIGSGSGIHSAAAWLAGAERVYSFDYDPDSVEATRQLHRHFGSPNNWIIAQGSVLDETFMRSLGAFDIVYSWGVLHHTGDQWRAVKNTFINLHKQSRLFIALYAKEAYPDWKYWLEVKQRYNRGGFITKYMMELHMLWSSHLERKWFRIFSLPQIARGYRHMRGMALMTDIRDWLGGWPTEFSSIREVASLMETQGLAVVDLSVGEGNTEFLCVQRNQVAEMGYTPVDFASSPYNLAFLQDVALPSEPVWIFSAGRGGELIYTYLSLHNVPVAGFIDVEATKPLLHGLPVLHIDNFIAERPKTTLVILANQYVRENGLRLANAGYEKMLNGHSLVTLLHRHGMNALKKVA